MSIKKNFLLFLFYVLATFSFLISQAFAIPITDLYVAQILVPSNDIKARMDALPAALEQVLIKASGNINITKLPQIRSQLTSANAFLQSYSYTTRAIDGKKSLFIQVEFDNKAVSNLLQQTGQKIWNEDRPQILVWLATSELNLKDREVKILAKNSANPIVGIFQDHAIQFGLPIAFPEMDAQDILTISALNICHANTDIIEAAAKRYNADIILAGCLDKTKNIWQGQWQLISLDKDNIEKWSDTADNSDQLVAKSFQKIFPTITKLFVNSKTPEIEQKLITLHISNINGLDEYSKVIKYIQTLRPVKQVQLAQIKPDGIELGVVCNNSKTLQEAIKNSNKPLLKVEEPPNHHPETPNATKTEEQVNNTNENLYYQFNSAGNEIKINDHH